MVSKYTNLIIGAFFGALAVSVGNGDIMHIVHPHPFENVVQLEFTQSEKYFYIKNQFDKVACDIQYTEAFGQTFGIWERLNWRSLSTGKTIATAVEPGKGLISEIQIAIPYKAEYDRLQIKTRHTCPAAFGLFKMNVDSVFWSNSTQNADIIE